MIPFGIEEELLYFKKEKHIQLTHCMRKENNSQMEAVEKMIFQTPIKQTNS